MYFRVVCMYVAVAGQKKMSAGQVGGPARGFKLISDNTGPSDRLKGHAMNAT